jgi:hypothetical protein
MKLYDAKASVADVTYPPPLADDRNIQPRLVHLSALLSQISEKLVDCPFAAKAHGYVDAAIRLELVNFDVMNAVCDEMERVQFCNAIRTLKEQDASELVKEAAALAKDLLIDMPLSLGLGVTAMSLPDFDINENKRYLIACDGAEEESENLTYTVLRGYVRKLHSGTKGVDEIVGIFEFAGSYGILAFPSAWAKYREQLVACERDKTYMAIKVQALKTGDYALIEILPNALAPVDDFNEDTVPLDFAPFDDDDDFEGEDEYFDDEPDFEDDDDYDDDFDDEEDDYDSWEAVASTTPERNDDLGELEPDEEDSND